jgi:hypothetical protein
VGVDVTECGRQRTARLATPKIGGSAAGDVSHPLGRSARCGSHPVAANSAEIFFSLSTRMLQWSTPAQHDNTSPDMTVILAFRPVLVGSFRNESCGRTDKYPLRELRRPDGMSSFINCCFTRCFCGWAVTLREEHRLGVCGKRVLGDEEKFKMRSFTICTIPGVVHDVASCTAIRTKTPYFMYVTCHRRVSLYLAEICSYVALNCVKILKGPPFGLSHFVGNFYISGSHIDSTPPRLYIRGAVRD